MGTAIKFDRAPAALVDEAVASMQTLNRAAAEALATLPVDVVHACTDITGFGLAGHASEMAAASDVTVVLNADRIPAFAGVLGLVTANQSGGMTSNLEHFGSRVQVELSDTAALDPNRPTP